MKIIILIIVVIIVFFLAVIFGVKNTQAITLAYLYGLETPPFPMYYLIFIPFIIGFVVGGLCGFIRRFHLHNTVKALQKSKAELEEKLKQMKEAEISREYETRILEEEATETEVIPTT
ncbi:MAG: DUF1049 domain-containing protein [Proteobacteria bacterium]|nr:DUF1049 domain-containing protein [Pseudomonadota bacterium]